MTKITKTVSKEVEDKFEEDLLSAVSEEFISKLAKQINKYYPIFKDEK